MAKYLETDQEIRNKKQEEIRRNSAKSPKDQYNAVRRRLHRTPMALVSMPPTRRTS